MLNITIVDKHPILRLGLAVFLKEWYPQSQLTNLDSIDKLISAEQGEAPDVIILGFNENLHEPSLNMIRRLNILLPKTALVVYDEVLRYDLIIQYLKAGVQGYLSKDSDISELRECLNKVIVGKKFVCGNVLGVMMDKMQNKYLLAQTQVQAQVLLTAREFEIATLLSEGRSTSWIAAKLGRKLPTISTTKSNIFKKLRVDSVVMLRDAILPNSVFS